MIDNSHSSDTSPLGAGLFIEAQFIRNSGGGGDSYESPYYGSPYQVGGSNDY